MAYEAGEGEIGLSTLQSKDMENSLTDNKIFVADHDLQDAWIELQLYRNTDPEDFSFCRRFHCKDIGDFLRENGHLTTTRYSVDQNGEWIDREETMGVWDWMAETPLGEMEAVLTAFATSLPHLHAEMDHQLSHHQNHES